MDPYEYLFNNLGVTITTNTSNKKQTISWKLAPDQVPVNLISLAYGFWHPWQAKHIFEYFKCDPINWPNPFLNDFCRLLQQFPDELESEKQVDLLLVLNGLQTTDENNS